MTNEERAEHLWRALNACRGLDPELTITTVTHWLEHHGAGYPDVPLMQERVRDDAKTWAMSASQAELEAYVAAAIHELGSAPITGKAVKRLAAFGFQKMHSEDQEKFLFWAQGGTG